MWEIVKLGDVCEFVRGPFGGSLKKNIFVNDGYAVYEQQHAINNQCANFRYYITKEKFKDMQRFIVKPNDILMSCSGTIGKTTIVPSDAPLGIINQALLKITASQEVDTLFLKLFMQSVHFNAQLMDTVDGAAIQNVASVKVLKQIVINLPPLAEQQRIVAKLDAAFAEIDTAIEVAEAKEAEVEKLKASLLSDLLSGDAVMWKTVKLGDALKTGAGGTPLKSKKEYYEDGNIKWLLSGAACERDIHDSKTHISEDGLANSSAKIFPKDSVLVAMYGATAGQLGILRTEAATNQAVCGIYPSSDYLPEFLYYYLTNFKETLLLEVSGVAQPNLSQIKIKNIPLPLISLAEQQRIVAKLDAAFAEIDSAKQAIQRAKENHAALKAAILAQELTPPAESEAA